MNINNISKLPVPLSRNRYATHLVSYPRKRPLERKEPERSYLLLPS